MREKEFETGSTQKNKERAAGSYMDTNGTRGQATDSIRVLGQDIVEKKNEIKQFVNSEMENLKARFAESATNLKHMMKDRGQKLAKATDAHVRKDPWKAVGIVTATSLVLGFILGRRNHNRK